MSRPLPPDQAERLRALDAARSVLVQAPAGSGKTDLLTRRFLRLLGEVDDPGEIVAITFTRAAAAEMRHRILAELERAAADVGPPDADEFSMPSLARRALARSRERGWQLPELPAQLHISTIDSFCRDLAIQQPLLTGLGSDLAITEQPDDLYRRAARAALQAIAGESSPVTEAIELLLQWRDNGWHELESLLVEMLRKRDRWMHDFVFEREPDWDALRARLERPFARAIEDTLIALDQLLDRVPHARAEAHALARFACAQLEGARYQDLAELAEFPAGTFNGSESRDTACRAFSCLADLLLTNDGVLRKRIDRTVGFPADRKVEKGRIAALIAELGAIDGFEAALAAVRSLPPAHYPDDEWQIVRACFTLLRRAAAELRTVFAEAGTVDFVEVSQIAQRVLVDEDGLPSDAAIAVADGIHHLLVDEFQDTSRRQHRLLASLAAAWPDQNQRTIFVVGDPMQSIYFFRDADAELFDRVRAFGLETPGGTSLPFDFAPLAANFRTEPTLVFALNQAFSDIFAQQNGRAVPFSAAEPARPQRESPGPVLELHLRFTPQASAPEKRAQEAASQAVDVVAQIHSYLVRAADAMARGDKYRIAVLARTRKSLVPIAATLREASIPFLAVELEALKDRPEVLDALALARALLNPFDRVAWLGLLRAPWCGLSLADLHALTSADDGNLLRRPIPDVLAERIDLVSPEGRTAVERVLRATASAADIATVLPNATLGTRLEQIWLSLGGASCVDATARANLDLLWSCFDNLPNGAQDLLSPALDAALDKLTALPDVNASADCGVQLMTIHKSKGLEFEVVLVPDLQARSARTRGGLLSWLERGLTEPDDSGELTEFLVAPLPTKGSKSGNAKAWVDRVYREREAQEMRRILYVAATRAREELHLFARPAYKEDERTLVEPADSLLATAWPAFEDEVHAQFDAWLSSTAPARGDAEEFVPALAAQGELAVIPAPTLLHRLPVGFVPPTPITSKSNTANQEMTGLDSRDLYTRHKGGVLTRALGTAAHTLLEELARLRATLDWPAEREAIKSLTPRISAQIRSAGINIAQAESLAQRALDAALAASGDPYGQWILGPRESAVSEAAWSGVVSGTIRTVRVDRVFRAGLEPLTEGTDAWWIVDYKTAHADELDQAALPELRRIFAPQLEAYATILRQLHGAETPMCAALYYPRMSLFDWWEIR